MADEVDRNFGAVERLQPAKFISRAIFVSEFTSEVGFRRRIRSIFPVLDSSIMDCQTRCGPRQGPFQMC
jgi:hypothetical protein